MSFDVNTPAITRASPIQFVHIEITPLLGGQFGVVMQATTLNEEHLELIGQDLADERVNTLDEAMVVIRENVTLLAA